MDPKHPRDHPPPYDPRPVGEMYAGPASQPVHMQMNMPQQATVIVQPNVILIGRCPACNVGVLTDHFSCLGIFCAIFFFPLGILCCLMMTEKRCCHCGAHFG
ncbi:membrane protein BRI3-like [Arctopsyche grandis]|uniref:membrane protein BRI3-like n=1 Tax=Arctopsyche grandis TaxID=121162 RepID=UPI00406D9C51